MECKVPITAITSLTTGIRIVPEWNVKCNQGIDERKTNHIRIVPEWNVKFTLSDKSVAISSH